MTKLVVMLITLYHSLLRTLGMVLGLLTAGLWLGYKDGVRAINDMYKFLAYQHRARLLKAEKEKRGERKSNNGEG